MFHSDFSLTSHDRHKDGQEEFVHQPIQRQRYNSGDSVSSHSSERSDKGDNSKALFKAYQNRYKEHAEKQAEESTSRTPFSSWRRSGQFEEESKNISSKSVDSERPKVERHSKMFLSAEDHDKHDFEKKESTTEGSKRLDRSQKFSKEAASPKQQEADKADELMFNFRKALRRHQISEERKTSEERDSSKDDESTAKMIEKIRAAKAQIKQLKESHLQPEDSKTVASSSSERRKLLSSSSVEESAEEKQSSKTTPKLARQKLVSDDLKAKYIENKKEEKEKVRPSDSENIAKKRSHRKDKHREHIERRAKSGEAISKSVDTDQPNVSQTDHYRKTLTEKFNKEASTFEFGTSFTGKSIEPKTDDKQKEKVRDKQSEKFMDTKSANVEHKKEALSFESVSKNAEVDKTQEPDDFNLAGKPVSSLVYQEPAKSSFSEPYGVSYTSKSATDHALTYKSTIDTDQTVQDKDKLADKKSRDTDRKTPRQMKKHAKAKTAELGLLSHPKENTELQKSTSQDDSAVSSNLTKDELSRKERIDKYKEERKKQLASIFGGGDSELPSLFLSSRAETEVTPLSRSKSLKVESDSKPDSSISSVGRSKSMKEEAPVHVSKLSGLQLAEIGSQTKESYDKQHRAEVSKHQPKLASDSREIKAHDKEGKEITHRTMLAEMVLAEDREHAFKTSLEKETDSGHESTDSSKRIKRRLPSLEDVLGTHVPENYERRIETKVPTDYSLEYAKVKITPKSIPVEMSQGQVLSKRYEKYGITRPQDEMCVDYSVKGISGYEDEIKTEQKLETDKKTTKHAGEVKSVKSSYDSSERQKLDNYHKPNISDSSYEKPSDFLDSEIPKDSVSKMSKHFLHSEKSDSMVFGSDYRLPKSEYEIKSVQDIKKAPDKEKSAKQYEMRADVSDTNPPVVEHLPIDQEFDNRSDRRSSTPERVISVSDAWKLFSEKSELQVFGTDYVPKVKEPSEVVDQTRPLPAVVDKDSESVFNKDQTELTRQMLFGVKSSSEDEKSRILSDSHTKQKHHKVPAKDETVEFTASKPPLSPRTERKRAAESKFGKVSYRSHEREETNLDLIKERERSKSRELSKEKEIQKHGSTVKERSPSLESIPKASSPMVRTVKERSPSAENLPKTGVAKISYRDLEKSKKEKAFKIASELKGRPDSMVFGSDFRTSVTDSEPKAKHDTVVFGSDYVKPKGDIDNEEKPDSIVVGSAYTCPITEVCNKDTTDNVVPVKDHRRRRKVETKNRPVGMVFGSDYRKHESEENLIEEDKKLSNELNVGENVRNMRRDRNLICPGEPTLTKIGQVDALKRQDSDDKKMVLNILTRSVSTEDKHSPISKPDDIKLDIKAEAVSSASGHIIEVPVSPRQKSSPKILSPVKQDSVPKIELKSEIKPLLISKEEVSEVKPITKHKSSDIKEEVPKATSTQILLTKQITEPHITKLIEKETPVSDHVHVSTDKSKDQITVKPKTVEKERSKPVQYVHPTSPLLTFSAKAESPKKLDVSESKTQLIEKKTDIKSSVKGETTESVKESDKQFIAKRAKEEAWKKPVDTSSEFHKKTVEKMLLDTSLDDILSRNVDYLSDTPESSGSGRGRAEKKTRPQSVHEESRSHGRTKRIFKKKSLQRSKSEDRTRFKVEESGVVRRSKDTEDIQRSKDKAGGEGSGTKDSR